MPSKINKIELLPSKINKIIKVMSQADSKTLNPNVEAVITMLRREQEQFLAAMSNLTKLEAPYRLSSTSILEGFIRIGKSRKKKKKFWFEKSLIDAYCNRLYGLKEKHGPFHAMAELKQTALTEVLMHKYSYESEATKSSNRPTTK